MSCQRLIAHGGGQSSAVAPLPCSPTPVCMRVWVCGCAGESAQVQGRPAGPQPLCTRWAAEGQDTGQQVAHLSKAGVRRYSLVTDKMALIRLSVDRGGRQLLEGHLRVPMRCLPMSRFEGTWSWG